MKSTAFLTMLVATLLLSSCFTENVKQVKGLRPIYGNLTDLQQMIKSTDSKTLKNPGKIYVKGNLLFINEIMEGVHVYDNSDPSNPTNLAFIAIPGNIDIAMKGDFLYADYINGLATIDLSDIYQAKLTDFNGDYNSLDNGQLFPPRSLLASFSESQIYFECPEASKGTVIGWETANMPQPQCYIANRF